MLYTFTITSNESDNFKIILTADGDLKMNELHEAIQKALDYDAFQMASFFTCDEDWQKQEEITLIEMDENSNNKLMSEVQLSEIINNEEQNILYLFDFFSERYYFLSLININESDEKQLSIKVCGSIPQQIKIEEGNLNDIFNDENMRTNSNYPDDNISFENIDNLDNY